MKKYLPIRLFFLSAAMLAVFTTCQLPEISGIKGSDSKPETESPKKVAKPTESPANGHAFPAGGGQVTLSCSESGAKIYYILRNTGVPTTEYTSAIPITQNTTIRAVAKKTGMEDSDVLIVSYTVPVSKAAGAAVSAPTQSSVTTTSVTLNAVTAPDNGQTVEYGRNIANAAPSTWQAGTTFSGLTAGTTYYFFARSAENANYNAGAASSGTAITTTSLDLSAMEFAASMKIGWNLGNTLEAHNNMNPSETAWGNPAATQALMNGVAARGFGAVRIPVTWGNKIGPAPNYTIDSAWLNRVAEVVEYVRIAGMKAIINIHHDGADSNYWLSVKTADLTGTTKDAMDAKFTAVWTQIAQKFINTGDHLLFEAFNELHDGNWGNGSTAQRNRVNELNQIFVTAVRAVDGQNSNRYLVIPGWVTRASITVSSLVLPTDTMPNRLIVTFHYYDPYDFTGSANWTEWGSKAIPSGDRAWANENYVQSTFNSVRNKFVNNGVPVIIGEYGAVNQSGAAFAYRKYYMEYVTKYAHDCGFIPFYWDNAGFGSGSEKFGLLRRNNGEAYDSNATEILTVMMKAVNENYSLSSITAP